MRSKLGIGILGVAVAFLLATSPAVVEAAGQITGAQIKNNSIKGKDIKDKSIALKDIKPSTVDQLKGATGPAGPSAFDPPPTGTVIRGGGILEAYTSAATDLRQYTPVPVRTKVPLAESGPGRNLYFGGTSVNDNPSDVNATNCPGTAAAPTALPGFLCVYLDDSDDENVDPGSADIYAGATVGSDPADSAGFYIYFSSAGAGPVRQRYVWVYTAP